MRIGDESSSHSSLAVKNPRNNERSAMGIGLSALKARTCRVILALSGAQLLRVAMAFQLLA
jgi:hypothetical protein